MQTVNRKSNVRLLSVWVRNVNLTPVGLRVLKRWLILFALGWRALSAPASGSWDTFSDTWVATDALGRRLPSNVEVGPPRADRTVGIFYFLWHGAHIQGGPYDVTKILAQDPEAMRKPDSPLWGPLHAPHHWGESLFGYYLTDDEGVLRKHAQMLADAGVDMVIFDVTNQLTYPEWYRALLRVWGEMRALGNRTPQIASLTPFWEPRKVVRELWRDLYAPGLLNELWFRWEGKPLILADPDLIERAEEYTHQSEPTELRPGHTLAQRFKSEQAFRGVGGRFPTYHATNSAVTLKLFRANAADPPIATRRFENVADNAWLTLNLAALQPPGDYILEASDPTGRIGWWSHTDDVQPQGQALADGQPVGGDRTLRLLLGDEESARIREFFTFRKPQPDYFQGPTRPDMWSWLEVHPQHIFTNSAGAKEQMSVGVAQNAVNGRLGCLSEPGARGRSFHNGATDPRPDAVLHGFNFAEQWERALKEDPRFIFVTGWNEWIAGRFAEFNGVKLPVMFVDQFDQEHSRDIEPMTGGHGDNYYYQLAGYVRRYKGVRPPPPVKTQPIRIDGKFEDWRAVEPEFRDTLGDSVRRQHRGWDAKMIYTNHTGRNDLVAAKVSYDKRRVHFHVRTRGVITPPAGTNWMLLFLDLDANAQTGWLGYDFVLNRVTPGSVERNVGGKFQWQPCGQAAFRMNGAELELSLPWADIGLKTPPEQFHFKWADNCIAAGDWTDFTLNGDAAPNDRFNYRASLRP
ncbi:MAG TPA: hypothetical protein VI136_24205 [Verrucomicrobiae bacterium]